MQRVNPILLEALNEDHSEIQKHAYNILTAQRGPDNSTALLSQKSTYTRPIRGWAYDLSCFWDDLGVVWISAKHEIPQTISAWHTLADECYGKLEQAAQRAIPGESHYLGHCHSALRSIIALEEWAAQRQPDEC